MRYVLFRMICGRTITDALREIHWSPSEFWHLVDLKMDTPFRAEYLRAKQLQGRAFGDAVITIAEGRDSVTRKHAKRMDRIVAKATRRIARQKSPIKAKMILAQLLADLREHDKIIMTRNKLQVDSTKWLAGKVNPAEFGESSRMSIGGGALAPDGDDEQKPILVQFIGKSGKAVSL